MIERHYFPSFPIFPTSTGLFNAHSRSRWEPVSLSTLGGRKPMPGIFCETRTRWLDRALIDAKASVWLFMHHNPVPTGIAPTDSIMLLDHVRFAAVIEKHAAKIRHILHDHYHLPLSGTFKFSGNFEPDVSAKGSLNPDRLGLQILF